MIINKIIALALVAGLASPVAAATLDFTADNATAGTIAGTSWEVRTRNSASLTNATHGNNIGCTGEGWDFACNGDGPYDVGFGINGNGSNNNEIDGRIDGPDEFVEVRFGKTVKVTGFAGMLTYADVAPADQGDREQVRLQYRLGDSGWLPVAGLAEPIFVINEGNGRFDTVGLSFRDDLMLIADRVRFRAWGQGTADDGTFNVTAAGLQVSAVPVPAGLPLLLAGVGAFGWVSRRKKRATD